MSRKILPEDPARSEELREFAARQVSALYPRVSEDQWRDYYDALRTRARQLPVHSQAGRTGWRFEQFRTIARYATTDQWERFAQFASGLALGKFQDDATMTQYWHTVHLAPRYKPETMSPDDPRPLGAPDVFWRWTLGTVARCSAADARRYLGDTDYTIGVPAGYEAMCLAMRADVAEHPDVWNCQGDVRNAFNEMERMGALWEAAQVNPLLGLAAAVSYGLPTDYLADGGDRRTTSRGSIQGCPLGMVMYCLGTRRPRQWTAATLGAAAHGKREVTTSTPGLEKAPAALCAELTRVLRTLPEEETEGEEPQAPLFYRQRNYADNGGWAVAAPLLPILPSVAAKCMAVVGLTFKPTAWEAWSQRGARPAMPLGQEMAFHAPEDGMVVLGGGLSPLPPAGVLGPASAVRRRLQRVVTAVDQLTGSLRQVVQKAAGGARSPKARDAMPRAHCPAEGSAHSQDV